MIIEASVHLWDMIRWITGSEIESVFGLANEHTGSSGHPIEHTFVAIVRLTNGIMACIDMTGALPKNSSTDKRFGILGSRGCIYIDEFKNYLMVAVEDGFEANPHQRPPGMTFPDVLWHSKIEGGVRRVQEYFVSSIINDKPVKPDVNDSWKALEIATAVIKSLKSGRPERIGLD